MVQHKHLPRFSPNHWSMILMVLLASVIKNILILTPSKRHMSVGSPLCVCVCVCKGGRLFHYTSEFFSEVRKETLACRTERRQGKQVLGEEWQICIFQPARYYFQLY